MLLVVPCDPMWTRLPDPHFADEAAAAHDLGVPVALLDHDALVAGCALEATSTVPASDDVVYRGWMVDVEQYAELEAALAGRGARLRSTAQHFRTAHELLGWYPEPVVRTPRTVRSQGGSVAAIDELRAEFATGGAGLRTWWIDGRLALSSAHPDTPDDLPQPPGAALPDLPGLQADVTALGLPFVTVDLARSDDGTWRVVELGDGQVSDRPRTLSAVALIAGLDR